MAHLQKRCVVRQENLQKFVYLICYSSYVIRNRTSKIVYQEIKMHRDDLSEDLWLRIWKVAERAIHLYAQGVLSVQLLAEQLAEGWYDIHQSGDPAMQPSQSVLMRIALRICSRELFFAWRSEDASLRDSAFTVLRKYLERSLLQTRFATVSPHFADGSEDILHQTLETLQRELFRGERAGPNDPAAFLKWSQTILIRHARTFVQHSQHDSWISLDAHQELFAEQLVDKVNRDPLQV